jgi:hypothetical protein
LRDVTAPKAPARDESGERADEVRSIARWLSLGSLIPVLGWVYGVGLLWSDPGYTRRQKVIGTLAFPGGWFGALAAAGLITWETGRYCYSASFGATGGPVTAVDSGCVQTGAFPPAVGFALLVVVVVAAALGPAYVRRQGLRHLR